MSTSTYPFACPHCGAVSQVPEAQLGAILPCPACTRPFRPDIPAGKPVGGDQPSAPPQGVASPAAESGARPDGEESMRLHPAVWRMRFAATCFDAVLVLGGLAVSIYAIVLWQNRAWALFFLAGGGALWLVGGLNLALPWIKARGETLEITAVSTRWTCGWFKRRSVEIRHDAVRAVEVEQTFAERLLGIGTLTLASDGSDEDEIVMRGVPGIQAVAGRIRALQGK